MDIELKIASVVLVRLLSEYLDTIKKQDSNEKPILMPITRKGYWLFRILYDKRNEIDNASVFDNFVVWSDRYASKVIDGKKEFSGKYILLFDDVFNTGTNMFAIYTMLAEWEAKVTPLAYRYVISDNIGIAEDPNCESIIWHECEKVLKGIKPIKKQGEIINKYHQYIKDFNNGFKWIEERHVISNVDRSSFCIKELQLMENELCPMVIDLPIFIQKDKTDRRYVQIADEVWQKLIKTSTLEWKFVKNIYEEEENVTINSSFFCVPDCIMDRLPKDLLENCIVKCKYRKTPEGVDATFVPFAIMKSITYDNLVECFCDLYGEIQGGYYSKVIESLHIKDGDNAAVEIKNVLIWHVNLYRAIYRAVVWYFSNYIGMEFQKYFEEIIGDELGIQLDYDWEFMEQHIPKELKSDIKRIKDGTLEKVYERLEKIVKLEFKEIEEDSDFTDAWVGTVSKDEIYDCMKYTVAERKLDNTNSHKTISVEYLENESMKWVGISEKERRLALTQIIVLFLEESAFSNYVENMPERGIVKRGFIPGENSTILFGKTMRMIYPYVYAYYSGRDYEEFCNGYKNFSDLLRAYFERKDWFDNVCTRKCFDNLVNYFNPQKSGNNESKLKRKVDDNFFIVKDYLEGQSQIYTSAFALVDSWNV